MDDAEAAHLCVITIRFNIVTFVFYSIVYPVA